MSQVQLDPRTFQNMLARLDRIADFLRPKSYTTVFDNKLLDIAAAAGQTSHESELYDYETQIKEIEVCADRYDPGDCYSFVIAGAEYPKKETPFYAFGSANTSKKRTHAWEGNLPVCESKKPIQILWTNGAAQAKKVSITFKRLVAKEWAEKRPF
jgi:hypothetical protein